MFKTISQIAGTTVQEAITDLYYKSGTLRYWRGVRYCSSLLRKTVDSISPFITTILVNGKQVINIYSLVFNLT